MPDPDQSRARRVAILGAGGISGAHVTALKRVPNVELVAVCDLDEKKARALQELTGAPHVFRDLQTMLEHASPDAVHVLLPPAAHAPAAAACLSAGAHVFVEKPLCVSTAECRDLELAAQRSGRQIGVNHNLTFMPGFLAVLEHIRNCRFGAIEHVTVNFNLAMPRLAAGPHNHWMFGGTGNLLYELGVHPLSVIHRLVGGPVHVQALASGELRLSNDVRFYHTWQTSMLCERGTAQLLMSVGKAYTNAWIHILGEDAEAFIDLRRCTVRMSERTRYIRIDDLVDGFKNGASLLRQTLSGFSGYALAAIGLAANSGWQQISFDNSIAGFYAAIAAGTPSPAGISEGCGVVKACSMMVESAIGSKPEMEPGHRG